MADSRVQSARRLVALGATATTLGIALSLDASASFAGALAVVGIVLLVFGLHRVGRLGPDA